MTAPLDVSGAAIEAQPEAGLAGLEAKAVEGRSLGQIAWLRLRRDKVAIAGGVVVAFLIVVAVLAPLIVRLLGHPPNEFHQRPDRPVPADGRAAGGAASAASSCSALEPRERARPVQPGRLRRPDLAADRLPRHRAVGRHRHRRSA